MVRKKSSKKTHARAERASGRVKKPELPRTEPIRSWSTLFAADSPLGRAQNPFAAGASAASNAVQRGVELGYRVVDEYVRQGSTAAGAFTRPNAQRAAPGGDFPQMAERMLRNAQDFASVWFDMMGTVVNMAGAAPAGAARDRNATPAAEQRAGDAASHDETASAGPSPLDHPTRSRVIFRIESARPTEITLTLDQATPGSELRVEPLRKVKGSASIDDVSLALSAGPRGTLTLKARIPAEIPTGRYSGALVDASEGKPRGRLTISISS